MNEFKLGKYRHYKGKFYEVIGVARHSETLEELVIYRALYESAEFGKDALWVRPKKMFFENVVINGVKKPRFEYVAEQRVGGANNSASGWVDERASKRAKFDFRFFDISKN